MLPDFFNPSTSIDEQINALVKPASDLIAGAVFSKLTIFGVSFEWIVAWLVVAALFCTFYFRFVNLTGFVHGLRLINGRYKDISTNSVGEVTHFQALATAVSGTVGLGNIAGVAVAVALGGPGATFWMIVAGFLGMSSKFCECTLGVKYRRINPDGTVSGGPMYYLSRGIAENFPSLAGFGKVLAVVFAVCCIGGALGGGNMFQANQAYGMLVKVTGGDNSALVGYGWLFGLGLAVLTGLVIIGGIKSIARVTSRLVPIMAVVYVIACLVILAIHADKVLPSFGLIITEAFNPSAAVGGVIGVLIIGFRRAAFSNEAGIGSASIAHSAVKTDYPVSEGLVALWEPFIDTVVICTMTALVIIVTGLAQDPGGRSGIDLAATAFGSVISWFPYVLALAVFLFAYSTMISWAYYGAKATAYLFGESQGVDLAFKLVFLTFTVIGCSMQLGAVVDFSDAMIFLMAVPNVIGMYLLAPVVKRELDDFMARVRAGQFNH